MKGNRYLIFVGLLLIGGLASAQDLVERALIFSQTNPALGNTSRMQGIGGAAVSLGADMSSVGVNPAGLGFYNSSGISFTPNMNFRSSNSEYFDNRVSSFKNNFNFGNLGIVFNNNKGNYTSEKFKGGSFAISFQRLNNFNNEFIYEGRNPYNSITDYFVEEANYAQGVNQDLSGYASTAFSQFLIENADGYIIEDSLIVPTGDFDGYTSLTGALGGFLPFQSERVTTSGSQNAINFAWGGNYDDRVYFGAGIGIETINYRRVTDYQENSFQDSQGNADEILHSITIRDERTIEGGGLNFNAGLIVRPVNFITIGLNYESPTYYSLNEEYMFSFSTEWNPAYSYEYLDDEGNPQVTQLGSFEYPNEDDPGERILSYHSLRTPARINLGTTFFLGKHGFISGDVEFVDYSNARLKSNDFSTAIDNQAIASLYNQSFNFRLGTEYRLDNFRLRAGFAQLGNPYSGGDIFENGIQNISFGVGYRTRDYFVDVAFINSQYGHQYSPYFISQDRPVADIENITNTVSATVGFNF